MAYNNSINYMAADEDSGDLGLQGDPILQKVCSTTGIIYEKNRKSRPKRERWVGSIYVQKINVGIG